jgi:hypothetical protein
LVVRPNNVSKLALFEATICSTVNMVISYL